MREHKWTKDEFLAVLRQFSKDDIGDFWTWLPLDKVILEQGVQTFTILSENISLRMADCLHLVTALHHGFSEIHTHDAHQIQAASTLGLTAVQIQ